MAVCWGSPSSARSSGLSLREERRSRSSEPRQDAKHCQEENSNVARRQVANKIHFGFASSELSLLLTDLPQVNVAGGGQELGRAVRLVGCCPRCSREQEVIELHFISSAWRVSPDSVPVHNKGISSGAQWQSSTDPGLRRARGPCMALASRGGRKRKGCLALHPDQASTTEQVLRDGKSGGVFGLFHLCFSLPRSST